MPTTKPRIQITETDEVAEALKHAAQRWPGEPKSRLLINLAKLGSMQLTTTRLDDRLAILEKIGDRYNSVYPDGYLEELRNDWPE